MVYLSHPVTSLLTLLGAIATLWLAAPPPAPRSHPPAQVAAPPERPELAVLRRFSRLDLTDIEPEALLQLRAALRALDPVRTAELLAERRRQGWENLPLDDFELYHDPWPQFIWPFRRDGRLAGWVVFEQQFEVEAGEPARFWLTYIDARGATRARAGLAYGPRSLLFDARLDDLGGVDGPVVVVTAEPPVYSAAPNRAVGWYARAGDRFELVREETDPIPPPKPAP